MLGSKAYDEAVRRWGDTAFVELVEETKTVNRHCVVGDGKGLVGFGETWVKAFEDADRRAAPPVDPGGGTPDRSDRRKVTRRKTRKNSRRNSNS